MKKKAHVVAGGGPLTVSPRFVCQGIVLLSLILFGVRQLPAQVEKEKAEKFIGVWSRDNTQDRGNCADLIGDGGENLNNCSIPFDQLPRTNAEKPG